MTKNKKRKTITAKELRDLLHYDPDTGIFTWRYNFSPRARKGQEAGCIQRDKHGHEYKLIRIYTISYGAHRLAFLYMTGRWPSNDIDHKDGDGLNNRWKNLRPATRRQNLGNSQVYKNNRLGLKGVRKLPRCETYEARITVDGNQVTLGYFPTPEIAHSVYKFVAERVFGEFARV